MAASTTAACARLNPRKGACVSACTTRQWNRGRGLLQLTGKDSYRDATTSLRIQNPAAPDFVIAPDEVFTAQWCLAVAAAEWAAKGCNALADQDNVQRVTRAINGGLIGLSDRMEWLRLTKAVWL